MVKAPSLIPGVAAKHVKEKVHHTYQKDPGRVRSMSVKLDSDRYRRLSKARYEYELTAQDIFIEALDLWFRAKHI